MFTILLAIIYLSFISLGLPDALLGSAWPSIYPAMGVPIGYAGIVSMVIAGGTIISSLFSDRLIKRLGTGKVTALSVGVTAVALLGFSVSSSFWLLLVWAVPYGLGAGSVDVALNNYVAMNYKASHMSWLHCFWGVGASLGPYIMGYCLTGGHGWNSGYRLIFIIQAVLTAILVFSLPLWRKAGSEANANNTVKQKALSLGELTKLAGAKPVLLAFFCYCALETTAGLWGASYLVVQKGQSADEAAKWIAMFYVGITTGRFVFGFITSKLRGYNMVRIGQLLALSGVLLLSFAQNDALISSGFLLLGCGCAPIYPSLLHATPEHFGKETSQSIMGMQMACAYIGSTFMPPLVGLVVENVSMSLYPVFLLAIVLIMVLATERLNKIMHDVKSNI